MRVTRTMSLLALGLAAFQASAGGLKPLSLIELKALKSESSTRSKVSVKAASLMLQLHQSMGLSGQDAFVQRRVSFDQFGQAHIQFQQVYQGVKVLGAVGILHLDEEGTPLAPTTDHLVKGLSLPSVQPGITADRALALALKDLKPNGALVGQPLVELVVHPNVNGPQAAVKRQKDGSVTLDMAMTTFGHSSSKDPFILAYHIHVEGENGQDGALSRDYILDATNGRILRKWNSLETLAPLDTPDPTDIPLSQPRPKLITGHSEYRGDVLVQGATVTFQRTASDGTTSTFDADTLWDTTRGTLPHPITGIVGNITRNLANDPSAVFGFRYKPGFYFEHADPGAWGDGQNYDWVGWDATGKFGLHAFDARGETAGMDAHAGIADTWDYYANIFGRDGIDDQGTSVLSRIHFFGNYPNAFWSTDAFAMSFGDGDGTTLKTVTALDVMGHELSHGVTAFTADLAYYQESGGINESNSDIMGTMVEFYARGAGATGSTIPDTGGNWTIGEQIAGTSLNGALRWFDKPSKDNYSFDNWFNGVGIYNVHASSGVGNRMFYYLSNGCPTSGDGASPYAPAGFPGLGNDKAARIWYRTLTTYLTPLSDYHDARKQALRAATDLYGAGSAEVAAVENAFAAVNVGGLHGQPDPPVVVLYPGNTMDPRDPYATSFSIIAAGEYSHPFNVAVLGGSPSDQAMKWSLAYGGGMVDPVTGLFHAPYRWPFQLAGLDSNLYVLQAELASQPLQYAQGLAFPVMADCDRDLEVDAVDMVAIAEQYNRTTPDIPYLSALVGDPFGVSDFSISDFQEAFSHIFTTE